MGSQTTLDAEMDRSNSVVQATLLSVWTCAKTCTGPSTCERIARVFGMKDESIKASIQLVSIDQDTAQLDVTVVSSRGDVFFEKQSFYLRVKDDITIVMAAKLPRRWPWRRQ